jgi:hypothetical protein
MALAKKLLRVTRDIPLFGGPCNIEVREDGIMIRPHATPRVVHSWPWEHLLSVCNCATCKPQPEDEASIDMV